MNLWAQFSAHKLGMLAHACNPNIQEVAQEDNKLKEILSYTVSVRPFWDAKTLSQGK